MLFNPSHLAFLRSDSSTFTDRFRSVAPALQNDECKTCKSALYKYKYQIFRSIPAGFRSVALSVCSLASLLRSGDFVQRQFERRKKRGLKSIGTCLKAHCHLPFGIKSTFYNACSTGCEKYLGGGTARGSYSGETKLVSHSGLPRSNKLRETSTH